MLPVISVLLACVAGFLRARASLRLEHLALRHQLTVYQRSVPRPRLRSTDRVLWAWLARLWPGWRDALVFVQPRTVIAWQRQRFRDHWGRLSQRGHPGRPAVAQEVRELIQAMWQANPTWGSPRIVGELRKLGIDMAKSTVEKYRPSGGGWCISTSRNTRRRGGQLSKSWKPFRGTSPRGICCMIGTASTELPFDSGCSTWASKKC